MNELTLKLTVEEVNTVLTGLGNMPYSQVFQLINKIQEQAASQMEPESENDAEDKKGKK